MQFTLCFSQGKSDRQNALKNAPETARSSGSSPDCCKRAGPGRHASTLSALRQPDWSTGPFAPSLLFCCYCSRGRSCASIVHPRVSIAASLLPCMCLHASCRPFPFSFLLPFFSRVNCVYRTFLPLLYPSLALSQRSALASFSTRWGHFSLNFPSHFAFLSSSPFPLCKRQNTQSQSLSPKVSVVLVVPAVSSLARS